MMDEDGRHERSSLVVVWFGLVCVLWFGNSGCVAWVWSRGHPCVWLMRIRLATVAVCLARQVAPRPPAWSIGWRKHLEV